MGKKLDLSGQQFGRLTVIKEAARHSNGSVRWLCKCTCGNEVIVSRHDLRDGSTQSCGCLQTESRHSSKTHGERHTRLYNIWASMKQRCCSPSQRNYPYYGGRGIAVCEEWKNFLPFYEWAMANGYRDDLTIDRKNVNGNYEPSNCRWASIDEQRNNTRSNIILKHNGETHTMAEWSKILEISYGALQQRLGKLGWSVEKALTTPVRKAQK